MAKRKTKTEAVTEANKPSATTIGYRGALTVKLQHGKRTLTTETYHNSGTKTLFKFICSCLQGTFTSSSRPCRIQLFGNQGCGNTPADFIFADAWTDNLTVPIINNTSATIDSILPAGVTTTEYYNVRYHFRIPYSYLNDAQGQIYKAALFSQTGTGEEGILAWFLFTTDDYTQYKPINIADHDENYSIIIEWVMTVSNN